MHFSSCLQVGQHCIHSLINSYIHTYLHSFSNVEYPLCTQAPSQVLGKKTKTLWCLCWGSSAERGEETQSAVSVGRVQGCKAGMCRASVESIGGELTVSCTHLGEQVPGKAFLWRSVRAYPYLNSPHEPLSFATLPTTELSQ